ncbi:glycosyltransferase [Pelagibacterales bacterium SAG-MED17]|nr:glycosyltransferase [Pelagibacterales bacterium SAG-MED17]
MNNKSFSIIIPVLNEKKNIQILSEKIFFFCNRKKFEIIFIDDNSSDSSDQLLKRLQNKYKNYRYYIRKEKFKDLSSSISLGITKSKFENIIVMDGDLQHDPKYLPIIMNLYEEKAPDFLVCVRNFNKRSGLSFFRFLSSIILIFIINLILIKKVSDPMSGFFIFKKKIYFKFKKKMYGKGFKFLFDILYQKKENFKVLEYEILFKKRKQNQSKMKLPILFKLLLSLLKKTISQ